VTQPTLFEADAPPAPRPASEIAFVVYGIAMSAGSKRAMQHPRTGKIIVIDANPKSREWKSEVKDAARAAYSGPRIEGPVELIVRVFSTRAKAHFRTNGDLKPTAPRWKTSAPDATKLIRGIEDAITSAGNVWRDDAQVCRQLVTKEYGEPARVEITIRPLE